MIVLGTNVLSAVMRREADQAVVTWLDLHVRISLDYSGDRLRDPIWSCSRPAAANGSSRTRSVAPSMRISRDGFSPSTTKRLVRRQDARQSDGQSGGSSTFVTSRSAGIVSVQRATLATHNARHFQHFRIEVVEHWAPR